jgi:dihydroxy-acid dehydratase
MTGMKGLRSAFEPGTTRWVVRRSQWRAMGISERDMARPKIAVVNSSSGLSVCYQHLDELAALVAGAIRDAGGLPFEIRTAAPSDFITSAGRSARYLMPSRDLIVNDIEVAVEGAMLDGMVCLSSCDKTTPAHLMAAARLDVPTIIVVGGYQVGGRCAGRHTDIDDVYESVGAVSSGRLSLEDLTRMTDVAIDGPGVCAGLGTANTMHMLAEALGMTMPGSTPVRAGSERMTTAALAASHRIVELIRKDIRPRSILTPEAFHNAVAVDLAISGSVNSVRHLQATAVEAGLDVDVIGLIETLGSTIPTLTSVRPNGPHLVPDLERAGGTLGVLRQLRPRLELGARSVAGPELGSLLDAEAVADEQVIRPLGDPVSGEPGLGVLRGTLAPAGALVKIGAIPAGRRRFAGPARIFEAEEDAIEAIAAGSLRPGDVVVLRGLGPKGGPGTVFAASFVAALNGAQLASSVACVTDGELSGLNRGIVVGQVMPEAALGGPLALIEDGDIVGIDIDARALDVAVDPEVLAERRRSWTPPAPPTERSVLTQYWHLVQPLEVGAVLAPEPSTGREAG